MRIAKRNILWLAVSCLCLLLLLSQSVSATTFQNAFVRTLQDSGELSSYLTSPVDDFSGHWEFDGDVPTTPNRGEDRGLGMLLLQDLHNRDGYMSFKFLDMLTIQDAKALSYGIYIAEDPANSTAVDTALYTITTTVTCGSNTIEGTVQVAAGRWYLVYSALPSAAKRRDIDSIQIRIDYGDTAAPTQVRLTSPCATDDNCAFVDRFATDQITPALGTVKTESTRLLLAPDNGGAVSLSANLLLPQYVEPYVSGWYMAVTVSGTAEGGSVSIGAAYGEDEYTSSSLSVQAGTNTYYFPVPTPQYTAATDDTASTGGTYVRLSTIPDRYSLHFQGVKSATSAPFQVTKVSFYPLESTDGTEQGMAKTWVPGNAGSVTEATLQDGKIVYSGKLTRQTVIDYSDCDVALLAVPLWERYDLTVDSSVDDSSTVELARMRVSKNFTFTLDANDLRTYVSAYLFTAALRVEVPVQDPAADPKIVYLPLDEPQMLTGTDPAPCSVSMFGLHGADTVGVFESNVSHVTVDVYWDKLLSTSGTSCSFGGKSYHLSQEYLDTLDSDVLFYIDAGLEVSLRILSSEPFAGSNSTAESYLPLVDTEESASAYGAVLSYLCSRYPGVASITLGKGVNHSQYTGLSLDSPVAVLRQVASLAAMTYEVARLSIPDVYIVVPFSDTHVYTANEGYTDVTTLDSTFALLLFADALEELGNIPWVASWRFEDDTMPGGATLAETAALPNRWKTMLQQLGIAPFRDFLYRWEPESCLSEEKTPYLLTARYEALCQALATASPRAVVLSLGRIADKVDPAMFADMTSLQDPSGKQIHSRQVISCTGILTQGIPTEKANTSRYTLWDFSRSYSAEGFIGSGGIDTIATTYSAEMRALTGEHSRVLRTVAGADGILLRNFAGSIDLSQIDSLSFTFRLQGESGSTPPTVVFFLGAEDWRMEYHVDGSMATGTATNTVNGTIDGEILTVTCPLDGLEDTMRCGYIGVILSGQTEITFDLVTVSVSSTELDEEALATRFSPVSTNTTNSRYDTEIVYILLLVLVATICIGVLLVRREREEEEEGVNHV